MSDRLLKVSEVADILRISQMTVIRKCRDGIIPFIMVGSMRRIREIDLEYYILTQSRNTQKPKATEPERPVYDGPPADECGFEDDKVAWQKEMNELCENAKSKIDAIKAKKASTVKVQAPFVSSFSNLSTGDVPRKYPSGFDAPFEDQVE